MSETSSPRARRTPRETMFAVIPTLFTLGNAVCGFGAITIAAMVGPQEFTENPTSKMTVNQMLFASAGLIYLAMVFDALDGAVARLTKQMSDFGAQLDSLCDVISFGVAPAFLMLKMMHPGHKMMETIAPFPFEYPPRLLWAIAVLFMVCAILRLARYNVDSDDSDSAVGRFEGLPSPAAAGVVASFPVGLQALKDVAGETTKIGNLEVGSGLVDQILPAAIMALPLISLGVALLMVSKFAYPHVFHQFLHGREERTKFAKILLLFCLIFVIQEMAIPVIFCYFAFAEPIRWSVAAAWNRLVRRRVQTA